jgi:hypothetical protein
MNQYLRPRVYAITSIIEGPCGVRRKRARRPNEKRIVRRGSVDKYLFARGLGVYVRPGQGPLGAPRRPRLPPWARKWAWLARTLTVDPGDSLGDGDVLLEALHRLGGDLRVEVGHGHSLGAAPGVERQRQQRRVPGPRPSTTITRWLEDRRLGASATAVRR